MAFYPGQSVQITQSFQDRAFTVNVFENGQVKSVCQQTGNVEIDFGGRRIVTFLPHELQSWLRPVPVAQPVYAQPAQPAYAPPANQNPMYMNQAKPAYVGQPAYVAPPQQPAYVAPPVAFAPAYGPPKPAYQGPAQPMYQPLKPQPPVYQAPKYAPPPVNTMQLAAQAVEEYKMVQEIKEQAESFPMRGSLTVRVGGCKKLPGVDTFGGCDPYVKLTYGDNSEKTEKKNTKNPEFNETFVFPVESEKYLIVEVWDYNKIGSDERIFALPLPLHGMMQYGFKQRHEFALSEKSRISLDLTYTPYGASEFKERQDVVVQFSRKPFGIQLIPGPNGRGAKIVGFGSDVAPSGGVRESMYVTMINGVTVIGTEHKIVMKLLGKAKRNSVLNFADLRLGAPDCISI